MEDSLFRRSIRLAGVAILVAAVTIVTYFAGYESGHAAALPAARYGDEISADERTASQS